MDAHSRFVRNFISARNALELTHQHVAQRMRYRLGRGWNAATVTNFEHGRRAVTIPEAEQLAVVVCVPFDRMFTESASKIARIAQLNARTGAIR
ncbi:helix-turn-helix domain-containing protein [Nocardia vaccinii]|uniref:helix-turn-helix domain-containing protein n=1 Tax=Nocardia vaccinii TaxID=1822 RepID=UPI00082E8729|nr:helix-turn-helix transcriptional regulator [Nocardia vaccinii]